MTPPEDACNVLLINNTPTATRAVALWKENIMSDFKIKTTEIPERKRAGRTPLPNPFTEHFPCDEKAITLTVPHPKDSVEVRRLFRQARIAANAVDRSPQIQAVEVLGKGEEVSTEMTVWTVERITRK